MTDLGIDTNRFAHADIEARCHITILPARLTDHVCMRVILAESVQRILKPCFAEHRSFDFQELAIFDRSINFVSNSVRESQQ